MLYRNSFNLMSTSVSLNWFQVQSCWKWKSFTVHTLFASLGVSDYDELTKKDNASMDWLAVNRFEIIVKALD